MNKLLKLTAILTIAVTGAMAETMYVLDEKVDLLDPSSKAVVGKIYEGTPVKVLKKEGDNSLIEVDGEVSKTNDKVLALKADPILTFLTLNDKKAEKVMKFLIPTKELTKKAVDAWGDIELTYYDTCTSCHAAHKPGEHAANEWDAYISAMQDFAKITNSEKDRIVRFMQAHASDGYFKDK